MLFNLSFQFVIIIAIMSGLGYWLDNEVDCVPLFTLIGTIFGLAVGMYHVIMEARRVEKKDEANKK